MKKQIQKMKTTWNNNKEVIKLEAAFVGTIVATVIGTAAVMKAKNSFDKTLLADTQGFIEEKELENEFLTYIIEK